MIADTHGLMRPEALEALRGSDLILHAGDVGRPEILDVLGSLAPLVAIRGNIDTAPWAESLPATAEAQAGPVRFFLVHDVHEMDFDPASRRYDVVVSGHSHRAGSSRRGATLYLNPGSAGPRRFRLPVTVARLELDRSPWRFEIVRLAI